VEDVPHWQRTPTREGATAANQIAPCSCSGGPPTIHMLSQAELIT
jgi:hypothetical protein